MGRPQISIDEHAEDKAAQTQGNAIGYRERPFRPTKSEEPYLTEKTDKRKSDAQNEAQESSNWALFL